VIIDNWVYTEDAVKRRAGLVLFSRYLLGIEILPHMGWLFGSIRKNRKGARGEQIIKQLICYFTITGKLFKTMKECWGYLDPGSNNAIKRTGILMD
jgi:hypothetical protein